jgi:TonB family protein
MTRFGLAFNFAAMALLLLLSGGLPAPCCSLPADAGTAAAPHQDAGPPSYQVLFSFLNEDLQEALPEFGRLLELVPVHVDPSLKGTVKIESLNPISREDAFQIFLGILRDNRAVLVQTADPPTVYTVMRETQVPGPGSEPVTALPLARPSLNTSTVPGVESPKREPIRVNENLQASKLIKRVEPVYPETAARAGITPRGPVRLWVLVNEQGEVASIKIYGGGHPLLQLPALEAVKQWRYSPFCVNGESVSVVATVQVTFDAQGARSGAAIPGAAPAVAKAPAGQPVRVRSLLQASKLIHRVEPVYPDLARQARIQGTVLLDVTVNEQGEVTDVKYMRGHPLVEQAVIDAVKQWRYAPTCIDGTAVQVVTTVMVPFGQRAP